MPPWQDVNGDGTEDFILTKRQGIWALYLPSTDGKFKIGLDPNCCRRREQWRCRVLFFDAGRRWRHGLVCSIRQQWIPCQRCALGDRLYINDGKGGFALSNGSSPAINTSKSVVTAADFDKRWRYGPLHRWPSGAGRYLAPASSYIQNNGTKIHHFCAGSSDAERYWYGYFSTCGPTLTNDNNPDYLWLATDADPFLKNSGGKFTDATASECRMQNWLVGKHCCFDNDGDMDYMVGTFEPTAVIKIPRLYPTVMPLPPKHFYMISTRAVRKIISCVIISTINYSG